MEPVLAELPPSEPLSGQPRHGKYADVDGTPPSLYSRPEFRFTPIVMCALLSIAFGAAEADACPALPPWRQEFT